ncbi:MAG: pilus assembly protein [Bdellovibrionales bacterium]|nr:pilus assembly protein [Bdellovibrionales bacterium]
MVRARDKMGYNGTSMKYFPSRTHAHQKGASSIELALLLPILLLCFLGLVQVIVFMQSSTATQYAAFMASRSFQVYGDRALKEIAYRKVQSYPYTHTDQHIVEASAEKRIFESLSWEQRRISQLDGQDFLQRVYLDGDDISYNHSQANTSAGAVRINYLGCTQGSTCDNAQGVETTYCAPIVFPGISFLFALSTQKDPCKVQQLGLSYSGLAITKGVSLGREPITP